MTDDRKASGVLGDDTAAASRGSFSAEGGDRRQSQPADADEDDATRDRGLHEHYMRRALSAGRAALRRGEVPVGCVIVWRSPPEQRLPRAEGAEGAAGLPAGSAGATSTAESTASKVKIAGKTGTTDRDGCDCLWSRPGESSSHKDAEATTCPGTSGDIDYSEADDDMMDVRGVVISHGANMVNATRDATRHAEMVALDRLFTSVGLSSDMLALPDQVLPRRYREGRARGDGDNDDEGMSDSEDKNSCCLNVPSNVNHWKNSYGWKQCRGGRRKTRGKFSPATVLSECDLYVTCEPCIMCAAALRRVGISRVIFGCHNDKFGGCGSLMTLHDERPSSATGMNCGNRAGRERRGTPLGKRGEGYDVVGGILKVEAIGLLREFYKRENCHAPEEKRKKKN